MPFHSSSDFSFASFASCWPSPAPNWVSGSLSIPDGVLVPQPDPTSWPIKLINSHPNPAPPFHVPFIRKYCTSQTTVVFRRTKLESTLLLLLFLLCDLVYIIFLPSTSSSICRISWLNYPLMANRSFYKH